jgi:uncharacterized protein with GYD domain
MPYYLVQSAYTPEAWATLIKNPQDRNEAVRPVIERLGGRLHGAWFAFGEYDIVAIVEMPDNVNVAAFSLAASAGGSIKALKTTPLMTVEEGIEAMRRAGGSGYRPPS